MSSAFNANIISRMNFHYPNPALPPLLIVDDSDDDIFLLRYRLREGGITNPIGVFTSPVEALRYVQGIRAPHALPAMIFTDIRLPVESGFALMAAIRENTAWDDIRVVVITSSNDTTDLVRSLELGVNGYLIKFPPTEILVEFVRHGPWFPTTRRIIAAPAESSAVHA